jgi:hypothetical protein
MKMVERKVCQPIILMLGHVDKAITFDHLSPPKALKCSVRMVGGKSMLTMTEGEGNSRILESDFYLNELDLVNICKNMQILSESGKTAFQPHLKIDGDFIEIIYKTGNGQFVPSPFKIPRVIPLDKEIFSIFGLIQAESTKKPTCPSFDFSNTTANMIAHVINYFERTWKIPRESWKIYVEYWRGRIGEKDEKRIMEYWVRCLSVHARQVRIRVGTESRLSKRAAPFGTAAIRLNNKIAQTLIMYVLARVKTIAENDRWAAGAYLCGLFAGDGIVLEHKGNLSSIGLSFNPHSDELDHYAKVLDQIGLSIDIEKMRHEGKRAIFFSHWRSYYTLLMASNGELFLPHRKNAIRFYKGFLANQYVKPLLKLRLFRNHALSAAEFAKTINVCKRAGSNDLNRCAVLGLLHRDGKGTNSSPFRYSLSDEGKKFLKIVEKIESFLEKEARA